MKIRCRRERNRITALEQALRELVDAVYSSQPEVVSNDLGNAMTKAEDVLKGRSDG